MAYFEALEVAEVVYLNFAGLILLNALLDLLSLLFSSYSGAKLPSISNGASMVQSDV